VVRATRKEAVYGWIRRENGRGRRGKKMKGEGKKERKNKKGKEMKK
jgi:hypothetical protein